MLTNCDNKPTGPGIQSISIGTNNLITFSCVQVNLTRNDVVIDLWNVTDTYNTLNPKWREALDLYWYEEQDDDMLEISIWDYDVGSKDEFMGR